MGSQDYDRIADMDRRFDRRFGEVNDHLLRIEQKLDVYNDKFATKRELDEVKKPIWTAIGAVCLAVLAAVVEFVLRRA